MLVVEFRTNWGRPESLSLWVRHPDSWAHCDLVAAREPRGLARARPDPSNPPNVLATAVARAREPGRAWENLRTAPAESRPLTKSTCARRAGLPALQVIRVTIR